MRTLVILVVVAASALASPALAWDMEGHAIVAEIAARRLSKSARQALRPLLGAKRLSSREVAYAPDEWKHDRPATRPWHWVNVPLEAEGLVPARDCPTGACVTAQIEAQARRLGDHSLSLAERREALAFVVHLVGDLHQPLHVGDARDRGGNLIRVTLGPDPQEYDDFHWIWDGPVVGELSRTLGSKDRIADRLLQGLTRGDARAISAGEVRDWADESHRLVQAIYSDLPADRTRVVALPPDYLARQAPTIRLQLLRAGLRLAHVLEGALSR